jgi:hypothetical protein
MKVGLWFGWLIHIPGVISCSISMIMRMSVDAYFEPRDRAELDRRRLSFLQSDGWYEFTLSSRHKAVSCWVMVTEDLVQYTPIVYDESEYIKPDATGYELGLGCQGEELWLYINGKLIRKVDVKRYGPTQGSIGLTVASFENAPVISKFDWFKVSTP